MPAGAAAAAGRVLSHRNWFLMVMGLLTVFAWVTLWLWAGSPYGRYLDHGDWTQIGLAGTICAALPAGEVLLPALLYVAGWVLMLAAMMLPTTLPLLEIYRRLVRRRADRFLLLGLVIGGYLAAWRRTALTWRSSRWSRRVPGSSSTAGPSGPRCLAWPARSSSHA